MLESRSLTVEAAAEEAGAAAAASDAAAAPRATNCRRDTDLDDLFLLTAIQNLRFTASFQGYMAGLNSLGPILLR